jgi:GWxTD domain-containing protein
MKNFRPTLIFMTIILAFSLISWTPGEDGRLHYQAKKYIQQRKWEKAIETYESLLKNHTTSFYCDNALFWIGFSWEQLEGNEKKAFESYTKLTSQFPKSPWVDDAVIHQISLAKQFVLKGESTFEVFLREQLASPETKIQNQAALALGELKDPSAVPHLEKMVQSQDDNISTTAMQKLEGYSITSEQDIEKEIESLRELDKKPMETMSGFIAQNLQKKGTAWTREELLLNGLYHILPEEDLRFYLSFENEWDRKEWWHKYWAGRDPTPTTPENEAEEEFNRRIEYVRENFGKDWYSTKGYYPPWDSRGELYIKFGKPDRRERKEPGWEKWSYYRYKVSFLVSSQKSNISGQGISFSSLSRFLYRNYTTLHQSRLLQKNQFLYVDSLLERSKKIKGMDLRLQSVLPEGAMLRARFEFSYPAGNLKFEKENGQYQGIHHYHWSLYNEDYRVLSADNAREEFSFTSKSDIRNNKISGAIELTIPPGSYILGLKIEDTHSNRLGLYRKPFTTQKKQSEFFQN